ncbi:MAG: amidohydrolase [Xanthobacteraceae bacterium]
MRWVACWLWLLIPSLVQAQPDIVLFNGKIARFDAAQAEALAIRDGHITALGSSAEIQALAGPATQVIDLEGRTVIPGLIDSHIHAIRAGLTYTTEVHWIGARSLDEALDRLRAAAARAPKGSWLIVAGGWIEGQFAEKRRPTQAEIAAAAPEHRVYVQMMYSAALLTRGGLEALGILKDAELGSRLTVDLDSSGNPTGWVSGDARTISDLYDKLPHPTLEQQVKGTRAFFRELNSLGITGVLDPGGYNLPINAYRAVFRLWREQGLTLRVVYSLCAPRRNHELEDFQALTAMLPMGFGDGWLKFNGIGENVTWSMYNNDTPAEPQKEQLYRTLSWAAQRGITATFHWNNNRSVHHLLDVLERVNREIPIAPLRWSIAHLNDASLDNLVRIKALGAGWLMQNALYFRGEAFFGQRGAEAIRLAPPIGAALRMEIPIGGGTDAHRVMSFNPFVSLQWMLDGRTVMGLPTRTADEMPTRIEALRLYTEGSAWFSFDDTRRGSLAVGKLADLAVLTEDYLTIPVDRIGRIRSVLTMVGGRIVHAAERYAAFESERRVRDR